RRNQSLPQSHVSPAFAVDARATPRGLRHALAETAGIGKGPRVQLRIAARQVDGVGSRLGRLVGEWREEGEAGACRLPARQQVLVEEGEGGVAGDGDMLAERRQAGDLRRARKAR